MNNGMIDKLKQILDDFVKNIKIDIRYKLNNNGIKLIIDGRDQLLNYEFISNLTRPVLSMLLSRKPHDKLIITNYVNPVISDEMKNSNINFLDAHGNCHIRAGEFFFYVKGMKNLNSQLEIPKKDYNITDIKLIFSLLANPELLNGSQRKMSSLSSIPLGSVGKILKKLQGQNFLVSYTKGYMIKNKRELFQKWCISYEDVFKPKMFLGNFHGKIDTGTNIDSVWGGEPAAYLLKKIIKPEILTVYIKKEKLNKFLLSNRLVKDADGKIEIYDSSWLNNEVYDEMRRTIHPFIIYADLMSTGNQRAIETAKIIYGDFIEDQLR